MTYVNIVQKLGTTTLFCNQLFAQNNLKTNFNDIAANSLRIIEILNKICCSENKIVLFGTFCWIMNSDKFLSNV